MSLNINFDDDWTCCHRTTTDSDDMFAVDIISVMEDSNWFPVQLPHVAVLERESTTDNKFDKWWYRKQFEWITSDQELTKPVYLTFKSSVNDKKGTDDPTIPSVYAIAWLNAVQIFAGKLLVPKISIELPQKLLHLDQTENSNHGHTLLVCCMNTCLSFHARLTIPCDSISNGEEAQFNSAVAHIVNGKQGDNDLSNDAIYFDDNNGLVNTDLDVNKLFPNLTHQKEQISDTVIDKSPEEVNDISVPILSIVITVIGSRGDVQPFIAYGKALRAAGHRVRLAAHETFRKFVRENDLEFYPLAGDPSEFMSFMVTNSGFIPSISAIVSGNIFSKRRTLLDVLNSIWLACTSVDDETGAPFRAQAIIANPISFGHVHCAQKLGIPLHMVFTMPYSPTTAFPHPLSNLDYSNKCREKLNLFSYHWVEMLMWTGLGDRINSFRHHTLDLPALHLWHTTYLMTNEKVPHTYCWSPSLVPKPSDWPSYIDVSGFFFGDLKTYDAEPSDDLLAFLCLDSNSTECKNHTIETSPPIFIGFGSITGHDAERLLKVVLDALSLTGYRALLTGFDVDTTRLSKTIFKIDDMSHDWLFQHVSAVCHHGGAGTTGSALRAGKPNIILPFFGDQFFWGSVIEKSGVGPRPLPARKVTTEELVEAFQFVQKPTVQAAAQRIREAMLNEDGCAAAVRAFHANLPLSRMRSDLEPTFAACFRLDELNLQISRPVAQVLVSAGVVNESQLRFHRSREWQLPHKNLSESNIHDIMLLTGSQMNTEATKLSEHFGPNNDTNSDVNKSHADCPSPKSSDSTGNLLTTLINNVVDPIVNTFTLTTKSNPNTCDDVTDSLSKNIDLVKQTNNNTHDLTSTSVSANSNDHQQHDSIDISVLARNAADISGFSPEVCKDILLQFTKLKKQHEQIQTPSLTAPLITSLQHH